MSVNESDPGCVIPITRDDFTELILVYNVAATVHAQGKLAEGHATVLTRIGKRAASLTTGFWPFTLDQQGLLDELHLSTEHVPLFLEAVDAVAAHAEGDRYDACVHIINLFATEAEFESFTDVFDPRGITLPHTGIDL